MTWCEHDKQLLDHIPIKGGTNGTASGNDFLWNSMRNRRLMFVGDSVTRYQYLDLIYFLTNKKFNHELKLINENNLIIGMNSLITLITCSIPTLSVGVLVQMVNTR